MLRGLVIRQALTAVDVLLTVGALIAAYFVIDLILWQNASSGMDVISENTPEATTLNLRQAKDKAAYAAILQGSLYGPSAQSRGDANEAPAPVEMQPTEVLTGPLKLLGTAAAHPTDPLGSAVIEDTTTKITGVYFIGQPVTGNMLLMEIRPKEVLLCDPDEKKPMALLADSNAEPVGSKTVKKGTQSSAPGARSTTPSTARARNDEFEKNISEKEIAEEIAKMNLPETYAKLNPDVAHDENGKVLGVTASNISQLPIADKLGFKDGDIVQKINNVDIDSMEKAFEVMNKYQESKTFTISVMRNGKPQTLVIKLN